jgi:hypothetical protein
MKMPPGALIVVLPPRSASTPVPEGEVSFCRLSRYSVPPWAPLVITAVARAATIWLPLAIYAENMLGTLSSAVTVTQ